MNYTIANIKLAKAKDPRWYLKQRYTLRETGACAVYPYPFEKYHMQTEEANINWQHAPRKAIFQSKPKIKYQNIYLVEFSHSTSINGPIALTFPPFEGSSLNIA